MIQGCAQITVDYAKCAGHGRCYATAPEVFTDNDQGFTKVIRATVAGETLKRAKLAAENCPEQAITILDT